jgi:hypothetical protein
MWRLRQRPFLQSDAAYVEPGNIYLLLGITVLEPNAICFANY